MTTNDKKEARGRSRRATHQCIVIIAYNSSKRKRIKAIITEYLEVLFYKSAPK